MRYMSTKIPVALAAAFLFSMAVSVDAAKGDADDTNINRERSPALNDNMNRNEVGKDVQNRENAKSSKNVTTYKEDGKGVNKDNTSKTGQFIDDAGLTTKVKSALAKDAGLKTFKLNVDSNQGAVTVTGVVNTAREKETIEKVVRSVSGVRSVNNAVTVQS